MSRLGIESHARVTPSAFVRRARRSIDNNEGEQQLPNAHFKKDWQGNTINGQCRVRTWLNQGTPTRSRFRSFCMTTFSAP